MTNEPIQSPPPPDGVEAEQDEKATAVVSNAESASAASDASMDEAEEADPPPADDDKPVRRLTVWDLFPHASKDPEVDAAYRRFKADLEAKAKQFEAERQAPTSFNDAPEAFITSDETKIVEPPTLRHTPPATREEAVLLLGRVAGRCEAGIENLATALWPGFHLAERQKSMAVAACLTNALANIVRTMNQIGGTKHSMVVERFDRTMPEPEKNDA